MDNKWFENLKSKTLDFSKKTSKNVNYVMGIKKTEVEILTVNREIAKIYKLIGEEVYAEKKGEREDTNVDTFVKQIDVKKAYIKELEKRIELMKEKKKLEEYDVKYVEDEIPEFIKNSDTNEEIEVLTFCPECNTGNKLDAKVCKECGKKLNTKKKNKK